MKIGYSYWGFLADEKYDNEGNKLSTPDGNAFYSWCIIDELLKRGNEVVQIMPNRDKPAELFLGKDAMFSRFCTKQRLNAYNNMYKNMYDNVDDWYYMKDKDLKKIWMDNGIDKLDVILHEWRMLIPGRNDGHGKGFQPDYFIQNALIDFCIEHKISLIIFDLDYKLTEMEQRRLFNKSPMIHFFELGHKWKCSSSQHVEIPFNIEELRKGIKPLRKDGFENELVYIGNRYERDNCIDRYIPDDIDVKFYGNWLQAGYNDCVDKWPYIKYGDRLQASEIADVYDRSVCTILFAKDEYYKNGFMTARILEALYYGCLPLFPINYGVNLISKYAGAASDLLTVVDKKDVSKVIKHYRNNISKRNELIEYLRNRLAFMDVQYIVNSIMCIGNGYVL